MYLRCNYLYRLQQAELTKAKANQNAAIFDKVTYPRLIEQQNIQSSNLLVSLLKSGADFVPGETPYLVNLKNLNNQAFDLALATYNKTMDYQDQINNSLLLQSKGEGELYKGAYLHEHNMCLPLEVCLAIFIQALNFIKQ